MRRAKHNRCCYRKYILHPFHFLTIGDLYDIGWHGDAFQNGQWDFEKSRSTILGATELLAWHLYPFHFHSTWLKNIAEN